jgi:hypothetical protein
MTTEPDVKPTLHEIEVVASIYSIRRAALAGIVAAMTAEIDRIKRKHLSELKRTLAEVAEREADLRNKIAQRPDLFVRPRSVIMHGIKFGYNKSRGGIEYEDADQVIKLIRKHFPERADVLIITSERPAKEALEKLSGADLKRLGCTVKDTGDIVFVKPADSDVEKMVDVLLKGAVEETGA